MYEEVQPIPKPILNAIDDTKQDSIVCIPPKNIKNRSLKGNKNYRKLRKDAKNTQLLNEVIKQLKLEVYNDVNYPIDDYKFDHEIVIDVMQIVERIFNEPKLGESKLKCVCEILKPYFLDNEDLIKKFGELNFHKIIKSNVVRRYGIKLFDMGCNFFLGTSEII
jgi:hypothetical protein